MRLWFALQFIHDTGASIRRAILRLRDGSVPKHVATRIGRRDEAQRTPIQLTLSRGATE